MEEQHERKINDTIEQLNREGLLNFWKDENDNPATIEEIKENKRRAFEIIDQRIAEEYKLRPRDKDMIAKYYQLRNDFDNEFDMRVRGEDISILRHSTPTADNIKVPMAAGGGGDRTTMTGFHVRKNLKKMANRIYNFESPLHIRARLASLRNGSSVDPNAFRSSPDLTGRGESGGGVSIGDTMGAFRSSMFGNTTANTTSRKSHNPLDDDAAAANDMSGYNSGGGKKSRRRRIVKRYTGKRKQNKKRRYTIRNKK
jgi:hypothetical protein